MRDMTSGDELGYNLYLNSMADVWYSGMDLRVRDRTMAPLKLLLRTIYSTLSPCSVHISFDGRKVAVFARHTDEDATQWTEIGTFNILIWFC